MAQTPASELQHSFARYVRGVAPFLAVVAQFGLIVLVVNDWQLENLSLSRLMALAFGGFIIHHLLPFRFRLPFFAILSLVAVIFGLGEIGARMFVAGLTGRVPLGDFLYALIPGLGVVGLGLGLIGLCHLPIRFSARVAPCSCRRRTDLSARAHPVVTGHQRNVGRSRLNVHVPVDHLSVRPQASHRAF